MTLFERGLSTGAISIGALLDGKEATRSSSDLSVADTIDALAVGGWPSNLDLAVDDALDANRDYLDMIVNVDVHRVDKVRRDPDGVRRLVVSYARNIATDATLRTIGRTAETPMSEATLHSYLHTIRRLWLRRRFTMSCSTIRGRSWIIAHPAP